MTWAALAEELDFVVSEYTLKRHIGSMHYHNCIACYKGWISGKLAPKRKDWAEVIVGRGVSRTGRYCLPQVPLHVCSHALPL
jgi:hypothetical protein